MKPGTRFHSTLPLVLRTSPNVLSAALAAVATGAMLGRLLALYREHREPFLFWAVVAWAGTLAGFLAQMPRALAWQRELWGFTAALAIAVKSLAFLPAGLTYRAPALVSRRRVVIGLGVAFVLAGVQTAWLPVLPPAAGALRELPITHARRRHPDRGLRVLAGRCAARLGCEECGSRRRRLRGSPPAALAAAP